MTYITRQILPVWLDMELQQIEAEHAQAEAAYQESVKEMRNDYQLRQLGVAPSMVRKIDLSIPF